VDEEVRGHTGAATKIEGNSSINFKSTLLIGKVVYQGMMHQAFIVAVKKKGIKQVIEGNLCQ
jgi:hypothetical protein